MAFPSKEEIQDSVWGLHPLKSPGLDGFQGIFYRTYAGIIKEKVTIVVQECSRSKSIPRRINNMFIVLIPKIA